MDLKSRCSDSKGFVPTSEIQRVKVDMLKGKNKNVYFFLNFHLHFFPHLTNYRYQMGLGFCGIIVPKHISRFKGRLKKLRRETQVDYL